MKKKIPVKIGDRYGRLVVLEEIETPIHLKPSHRSFRMQCDCGNTIVALLNNLRRGLTLSCGCYRHERQVDVNTIHGQTKTRLYKTWAGMKARCFNPNEDSYPYYGGRGISICKEWLNDFSSFYNWAINSGYADNLMIDRINNDGNYEPSNCRWATPIIQMNNKRKNIRFEFNGEKLTIPEICRKLGLNEIAPRLIWQRIHRDGYTLQESLLKYQEYQSFLNLKEQ